MSSEEKPYPNQRLIVSIMWWVGLTYTVVYLISEVAVAGQINWLALGTMTSIFFGVPAATGLGVAVATWHKTRSAEWREEVTDQRRTDMIREAAERTARADVLKDASTGGPEHALKNRGLSLAELSHAEEELFVLTYQRAAAEYERVAHRRQVASKRHQAEQSKQDQEGKRRAARIEAIRARASEIPEIPVTEEERWEAAFNGDEHQEAKR